MPDRKPMYRRPKSDPVANEAHFLRVGLAIAVVLFVVLPLAFSAIG